MAIMRGKRLWVSAGVLAVVLLALGVAYTQEAMKKKATSYAPVVITEHFDVIMERMSAAKPAIMKRQMDLLNERYDLSDRPAQGVTMSGGKAVQEGVRVKLPEGVTWEQLAKMTPDQIREKGLSLKGPVDDR